MSEFEAPVSQPAPPAQPAPFEPPPPPPPAPRPRVGPVVTILLTIAVFIAYSIAQALGAFVGMMTPGSGSRLGLGLAIGTLLATPFGVLLTWGIARWQTDVPVREYLGLRWPTIGQAFLWTAALFAVGLGYEALSRWLDRPPLPDFMLEVFRSAVYPWLLWLAVVVAAPIVEEILFRGYLFEGLRRSRLGGLGAVLVTSLLFALPHVQYDLFDMSSILALGLVFGLARWHSGSIYLTIGLHVLANGLSMLQMNDL